MKKMSANPLQASTRKTVSSVGWSVASKFVRQFLQLIFQILLARLLSPAEFGLIGMIIVFTSFAELLRNMGLGAALIQKQDATSLHYNSAFIINVGFGITLNILFQIAAPFIASFYNQPVLENVLRVYSFIFLIGSFNIVQEALLQKRLEFKRLFMMDAVSVTISGIVAIVLAHLGWGVWALVAQYLLISLISSIVLWITSSWKPNLTFSYRAFSQLRKYGLNLIGHELLNFFSRNIDHLLVGKFLGAGALGIYSRAYFLMLQPINLTNQVLARVMFPVLAAAQHNIEQVKRMYMKSTRMISFVIFPLITYIFIAATPLINLVLGNQWLAVAPLLQIFCLYCLIDTIGITISWIYKALGRTDKLFRWGIYSSIITIIATVVGIRWGITGLAWSYSISFLVFLWLPGWYLAFRLIRLSVLEMLKNIAPAFFCSIITGILLYLLNGNLEMKESPLALLLILFGVGALIYLLLSWMFNKESYAFLKSVGVQYWYTLSNKLQVPKRNHA